METLEELKAIIAGKPEGATHVDIPAMTISKGRCYDYLRVIDFEHYEWWNNDELKWDCIDKDDLIEMRYLPDIERIIELMELNKDMHTIVSGYLCGDEWEHWQEFNAGKFKL